MPAQPHPTRRAGPWAAVLAVGLGVVLLLAGYVLSIGPAARFTTDERLGHFSAIYWPVRRCVVAWPRLAVPLNRYIELWGEHDVSISFDDETGQMQVLVGRF